MLPVAVFSCFGPDPKPSGEEGDGDSSTGVVSTGTTAAGNCAAVPAARRFHQLSWFITDPAEGPILLTSQGGNPVWVERGILVYGGADASTDALLSDLWLFDLSNPDVWDRSVGAASELLAAADPADLDAGLYDYCRWHQLDSSGNPPLARGSMVYVPDLERFVVVGGWTEGGGTSWTTGDVMALDLRDIEAGATTFSTLGAGLPTATATWHLNAALNSAGDVLCQGTYTSEIINFVGEHICTLSSSKCTGCITYVSTVYGSGADCSAIYEVGQCPLAGGAYAACADDVYCTEGLTAEQRSVASPGLAGHVALYDPVADRIRVFGGASGCAGEECGAYEDALEEGQAGQPSERATLLNDVDLSIDPGTGAVTTVAVDRERFAAGAGEWPTEELDAWPSQASPGVHQLAVALTGLSWDRSSHAWTGSAVAAFGKGGTRYTALAPYQRLVFPEGVPDTGDPGACAWTDSCFQEPGEWLVIQVADDEGGEDDSLISATDGTTRIDLSATSHDYDSSGLVSVSDAVRNAAMVATDPERLLLIGGRNSSGVTGDVVDIELGGASTVVADIGDRYGAGVAWDPVRRTAYVFGGSSDTSVRTVTYDDDPIARGSNSSFSMGPVSVDVQAPATDPSEPWTLDTKFDVTHTCQDSAGGDQCFISWMFVYVPLRPGSSDLATLEIELAFSDGTVTTPMVAGLYEMEEHRAVRYDLRLPRWLEDGESVSVSVRYQALPTAVERYQDAVGLERPVLQVFSHSGISWDFLLGSLPAWAGTGGGWEDSAAQLVEADFTVDPPSGYAVTGNGQLLDRTATVDVQLYGAPPGRPRDFTLLMMEDLEYWGTYPWTGGEIDVFVDSGIDWTSAAWTELETHLEAGVDTDLTYLESILGLMPRATPQLLLLRQDPASDLRGHSLHGTVAAFLLDIDGEEWGTGLTSSNEARAVLAHEWAHTWIGQDVRFEGETEWFGEGLCQMVAQSMYDSLWASGEYGTLASTTWLRDRLRDGASASLPDLSDDLEVSTQLGYGVGSYVLLQAYLRYRATGATHAAFWWVAAGWLDAFADGGEATPSDVQSVLTAWTGSGAFYTDWVDGGIEAIPMLGLTAFEYDDVSAGPGSAELRQVQREMFPAWHGGAAIEGVPFLLACAPWTSDHSRRDDPAFNECVSLTGSDVAAAVPTLTGSDPMSVSLSEVASSGDPMPVEYVLHTGAYLHIDRDSIDPYLPEERVLRRCRFGATTPADCAIVEDTGDPTGCAESTYDADGDCYPAPDDCDDANAGVHPLQVAAAEDPCSAGVGSPTVDHNCDGWTCE